MEVLIKGKISLNSLVGIGSKIEVDGLEETIVVSSESLTGQKKVANHTNQFLQIISKAAAPDDTFVITVGRIPWIFSLIEKMSLVKNFMKSSQLRVQGSTELGLSVNLATVLHRNLGLFLFSSINDE